MLLRVRSKSRVSRIEVDATITAEALYENIKSVIPYQFTVSLDPSGYQRILVSTRLNLKHGDMVYVHEINEDDEMKVTPDPLDVELAIVPFKKSRSFHAYIRSFNHDCVLSTPLQEPVFIPPTVEYLNSPLLSVVPPPCNYVDYVEFDNAILSNVLSQCVKTKTSGWLYGRYVKDSEIPLGIKVVVSAITTTTDFDVYASLFRLTRVGCMLMDAHEHTLSPAQVITAGHHQLTFPHPWKGSLTGTYGSRFVTLILTQRKKKYIPAVFQVTLSSCALIKAGVMLAAQEELGLTHPVMYKDELTTTLPVESVVTSIPCGFETTTPLFYASEQQRPTTFEEFMKVATSGIFTQSHLQTLASYILTRDQVVWNVFMKTPEWGQYSEWTCSKCTYLNSGNNKKCVMCAY